MLTIEQMTPEQKIGRVLCARRTNVAEDLEFTLELIRNQACGCVQVQVNDKAEALIRTLREAADYPLLIINDMENGFAPSGLPSVTSATLAACKNREYTRAFAAAIARDARATGFSGCWSPVVDILRTPSDKLGTLRKAGDTAEAVTDFARDILEVFASYRFQGSCKHYPGGHTSGADTHMTNATNTVDEAELLGVDLVPYLTMHREGLLQGVMVDHAFYPQIDPDYPASLSKKVIGILRRAGYDGLIYTDSLAMMAILQRYGEAGAMVLALNAGNDIILPNYRTPTKEVYEMMLKAYKNGEIDEARLDEAVRHVMAAEAWCAEAPTAPVPVPENIEEILHAVSRDCVSTDCAEGLSPAIDPTERRLFVVLTEQGFRMDGPAQEISFGNFYHPQRVIDAIRERFPNAEITTLPEFPSANANDIVLTKATAHDKVVFVSFCMTSCYLGADRMTRRVEAMIDALTASGKLEALVHFGNPLATRELGLRPARTLFGYNAPAAQVYAFDVLAGAIPAKGTVPYPHMMAL